MSLLYENEIKMRISHTISFRLHIVCIVNILILFRTIKSFITLCFYSLQNAKLQRKYRVRVFNEILINTYKVLYSYRLTVRQLIEYESIKSN